MLPIGVIIIAFLESPNNNNLNFSLPIVITAVLNNTLDLYITE
jgi:hypothetical protein